MRQLIARLTRGRYLRRGLTWQSATLTVVVIVAAMLALGALARRAQPEYPVTVDVIDNRVVGQDPACSWEVDLVLRNDSDRRLRLVSVEIADVEDSEQGLLGTFGPAESIARTYRYSLVDCSAPGGAELIARYGPVLTTKERSISFTVD